MKFLGLILTSYFKSAASVMLFEQAYKDEDQCFFAKCVFRSMDNCIALYPINRLKALLEDALSICQNVYKDNANQLLQIASTLTDLGSSCRALNDDEKALICFQQASAMYQSTKTVPINQD